MKSYKHGVSSKYMAIYPRSLSTALSHKFLSVLDNARYENRLDHIFSE